MSKENREVLVHVDHMKKYFPVRKKGVLKAVDDVSFNIYKGGIRLWENDLRTYGSRTLPGYGRDCRVCGEKCNKSKEKRS